MRIIGHGLIATSLAPFADHHPDVVAVASGVSDSSTTAPEAFERECRLLYEVLAEARRERLRVVYFSGGGAIYGRWDRPGREAGPIEPRTAYGRHQVTCEGVIRAAGVRYLIARLPNVVGSSGSAGQLVPSLVQQALGGHMRVQVHAFRDLVDVDQMAAVLDELLRLGRPRDVVNVASGVSVSARQIATAIAEILGVAPEITAEAGGESQRFSTRRLERLVGRRPFAATGSYRAILERRVPGLAARLRPAPDAAAGRT